MMICKTCWRWAWCGGRNFYELIVERHRKASTICTSNREPAEWGTVFPDPRLVAAIVDRITYNAHILETGTQSYRLRTAKNTPKRAS